MKINRINPIIFGCPWSVPLRHPLGAFIPGDCVLVEAFSDGLVGYGECAVDWDPGYSYETVGTALHILQEFLVPAVLNQEMSGAEDLQTRTVFARGHLMAKAGLEMAHWDLLG